MFNILGEADPFLDKCTIHCTLSKKNGVISFTIVPKSLAGKDLKIQPLTISGTLNELDIQLPKDFQKAFGDNVGVISNLAEVEDSIKKAAGKGNTTTPAKTGETPKGGGKPAEPAKPVFSKEQQKIIKEVEAEIEKRKKDTDPEKRAYVRKQLIRKVKENKLDSLVEDLIDKELPEIKADDLFSGAGEATETQTEEKTEAVQTPAPAADAPAKTETKSNATKTKAKANTAPATKPETDGEAPPLVASSQEPVKQESDGSDEEDDTGNDNPDSELQQEESEAEPQPVTQAPAAQADGWL